MHNQYDFNDPALLRAYKQNGIVSIDITPDGGTISLAALASVAPIKSCWQRRKSSRVVVASTSARQANLPKSGEIQLPSPDVDIQSLSLDVSSRYKFRGDYFEFDLAPWIQAESHVPCD